MHAQTVADTRPRRYGGCPPPHPPPARHAPHTSVRDSRRKPPRIGERRGSGQRSALGGEQSHDAGARAQPELGQHARYVLLHGALAQAEAERRSARWSARRPPARPPRARAGSGRSGAAVRQAVRARSASPDAVARPGDAARAARRRGSPTPRAPRARWPRPAQLHARVLDAAVRGQRRPGQCAAAAGPQRRVALVGRGGAVQRDRAARGATSRASRTPACGVGDDGAEHPGASTAALGRGPLRPRLGLLHPPEREQDAHRDVGRLERGRASTARAAPSRRPPARRARPADRRRPAGRRRPCSRPASTRWCRSSPTRPGRGRAPRRSCRAPAPFG